MSITQLVGNICSEIKDGVVSLKIEDFYNFNKGRLSLRGRLGEKLQNIGELENYYIIIEIIFGVPKI